MTLVILFLMCAVFSFFFYAIGLRYLALLPIAFFLFMLFYSFSGYSPALKSNEKLEKYGIFLIWIIILLGIWGTLHFLGIGMENILLCLIAINAILRIVSYPLKYEDGKEVFQFGYYLCILILLGEAWVENGFRIFLDAFSLLRILTMGIIGFLISILKIWFPIKKNQNYEFGLLLIGTLIILCLQKITNTYLAVATGSLILTLCYGLMYYFLQKQPKEEKENNEISVRKILAGERITKKRTPPQKQREKTIYEFIKNTPHRVGTILEVFNILLVIIMIVWYIQDIISGSGNGGERYYRAILIIFIVNDYLLRKTGYSSNLERFTLSLIFNFAVYTGLLKAGSSDLAGILPRTIFWNMLCSLGVFYIRKVPFSKYLKKIDYVFWIIITFLATIFNIILLTLIDIPGQLLFSIIFFYVGIELLILFYAIQFIKTLPNSEEQSEKTKKEKTEFSLDNF